MEPRLPYVGDGADGCRRSAQIDLEEANTLHEDDPRRAQLFESAGAWRAQAAALEATTQPIDSSTD